MGKSNAGKLFLGMPIGTAMARLKKTLMLELLRELHKDVCFRCGLTIDTPEELSVDHKQSWLHVSQSLFWDISNIAYSHRRCNTVDRPSKSNLKYHPPEGEAWCTGCKEFHDLNRFSRGLGPFEKKNECQLYIKRKYGPIAKLPRAGTPQVKRLT